MKKSSCILTLLICLICSTVKSQVPESPIINYAYQHFKQNGTYVSRNILVISQNISPRVMKPGHPNATEEVSIMYVGNWLDITSEVKVTGPNAAIPKGVTALSNFKKGNNGVGGPVTGEVISDYKGPYVTVSFLVASDAAVGTHTVSLRRPRLGLGYDETIFYIEVYDVVRVHSIRFSNSLSRTGKKTQRGKITISGQNLNRITAIGNCGGKLSNITNLQKSDNQITFTATLAQTGRIDYADLMNSATPQGLINVEYPRQIAHEIPETNQRYLTIVN